MNKNLEDIFCSFRPHLTAQPPIVKSRCTGSQNNREQASDFRGGQVGFASTSDRGVTARARVHRVAISRDLQRCQDWNFCMKLDKPQDKKYLQRVTHLFNNMRLILYNSSFYCWDFWISNWVELGNTKFEDMECISSWKCTSRRERRRKMQNLPPRKVQESSSKEQNPVKCPTSQRRRSICTNSS